LLNLRPGVYSPSFAIDAPLTVGFALSMCRDDAVRWRVDAVGASAAGFSSPWPWLAPLPKFGSALSSSLPCLYPPSTWPVVLPTGCVQRR